MAFAASTAKILKGKKDKEGKSIAVSCQSSDDKVAVSKQKHFPVIIDATMLFGFHYN